MIITGPPEYVKWRQALALTESSDDPKLWGDFNSAGLPLASGRWQQHPSFVLTWLPKVEPSYYEDKEISWDELFDLCLFAFWTELYTAKSPNSITDPVTLAMLFHLHGGRGPGWDTPYAQRFQSFYSAAKVDA